MIAWTLWKTRFFTVGNSFIITIWNTSSRVTWNEFVIFALLDALRTCSWYKLIIRAALKAKISINWGILALRAAFKTSSCLTYWYFLIILATKLLTFLKPSYLMRLALWNANFSCLWFKFINRTGINTLVTKITAILITFNCVLVYCTSILASNFAFILTLFAFAIIFALFYLCLNGFFFLTVLKAFFLSCIFLE